MTLHVAGYDERERGESGNESAFREELVTEFGVTVVPRRIL